MQLWLKLPQMSSTLSDIKMPWRRPQQAKHCSRCGHSSFGSARCPHCSHTPRETWLWRRWGTLRLAWLWPRRVPAAPPLLGAMASDGDDAPTNLGQRCCEVVAQCTSKGWKKCFVPFRTWALPVHSVRAWASPPLPAAAKQFLGHWKTERKENLDSFLQVGDRIHLHPQ